MILRPSRPSGGYPFLMSLQCSGDLALDGLDLLIKCRPELVHPLLASLYHNWLLHQHVLLISDLLPQV
jgi:hypothetical protein